MSAAASAASAAPSSLLNTTRLMFISLSHPIAVGKHVACNTRTPAHPHTRTFPDNPAITSSARLTRQFPQSGHFHLFICFCVLTLPALPTFFALFFFSLRSAPLNESKHQQIFEPCDCLLLLSGYTEAERKNPNATALAVCAETRAEGR